MISFQEFLEERTISSKKTETPNIGDYYDGGYYIGNSDGYRIIVAPKKIEAQLTFDEAIQYAEDLTNDGFDDWELPSLPLLNFIHLYRDRIPSSESPTLIYWSNSEVNSKRAYMMHMNSGQQGSMQKATEFLVRPIRKERI